MGKMEFCNNLQFYRKKANLTQEELATKLGMTRANYRRYESESCMAQPTIDLLCALAEILNTDINSLVGFKAFSCVKQRILGNIETHAELALYFEVKMGHTEDWQYCQKQMDLNEKKCERYKEEARKAGISEEQIERAVNKGRYRVEEIVEENESIGWE